MKKENKTQDEIIGNLSANLEKLSKKLNASSDGNETKFAKEKELNATLTSTMTGDQMA